MINATYKKFFCTLAMVFVAFAPLFVAFTPEAQALQPTSPATQAITNGEEESSWSVFPDWIRPSYILAQLAGFFMRVAANILGLAGLILNSVVQTLVIGMGGLVDQIPGIDIAWTVLRDICNIVFIFAILMIGIGFILGLKEYGSRQLLARLIVVALLINFSMFATKLVIDVANLFTTQVYSRILDPSAQANCPDLGFDAVINTPAAYTECINKGISAAFMDQIGITTFYDVDQLITVIREEGSLTWAGVNYKAAQLSFLGMILFLIMAFVFFAGAALLMIRFIVLIFLMIFSPAAFVAMVLPWTRGLATRWWSSLFKQAFFAPLYFLMIWISLQILNGLRAHADPQADFILALSGKGNAITLLVNFFIIIGFLIGSLIVASSLGAYGASRISGYGKRLGLAPARGLKRGAYASGRFARRKAWQGTKAAGRGVGRGAGALTFGAAGAVGRNTFGRYNQRLANNKQLLELASRGDRAAQRTLNRANRRANSSYDLRNTRGLGTALTGIGLGKGSEKSRKKSLEERKKRQIERAKSFGTVGDDDKKVKAVKAQARKTVRHHEGRLDKAKQVRDRLKDERKEALKEANDEVKKAQKALDAATQSGDQSAISTQTAVLRVASSKLSQVKDETHETFQKLKRQEEVVRRVGDAVKRSRDKGRERLRDEKNRRQLNYAKTLKKRGTSKVFNQGESREYSTRVNTEAAKEIEKSIKKSEKDDLYDRLGKAVGGDS